MNYKYRVKGVVEKPFILRGTHFRIGGKIDLHIDESELNFIKERCKLTQATDLQKVYETPKPIQHTTQVKAQNQTQKVVRNEQPKVNGTNKVENTSKV